MARDPKLRRKVALKIPHPKAAAALGFKKRFLREARAAAVLNHPNIITVFETEEADDTCYIISAFCRGGTLAEFLDDRAEPISPRQAASLVAILADAVHYAHQCGVLHCDLKPGNVMLEPLDETSIAASGALPFVPLVTDFGLAHFLEQQHDESTDHEQSSESSTQAIPGFVHPAGTPGYMAPEQFEAHSPEIGRSTDVYGLGAILYELLTGTTPFEGGTRLELLEKVLREKPPSPRQVRRSVPGDLDAICCKCLEKASHRRYSTAAELSEDLNRFLRDEPTRARPLPPLQRSVRWTKLNPASAGVLATLLFAIVGIVLGLTIHTYKLEALAIALQASLHREASSGQQVLQAKIRAEQGELKARRQAYVSQTWRAWQTHRDGQGTGLCRLLNQQLPSSLIQEDLRGFEWFYLWHLGTNLTDLYTDMGGTIQDLRFSPIGRYFAASQYPPNRDVTVGIWDVERRSLVRIIPSEDGVALSFSQDGQRIMLAKPKGAIETWDLMASQMTATSGPVFKTATFSDDGKLLAFTDNDQYPIALKLWDVTKQVIRPFKERYLICHLGDICFSHDSKTLTMGRHTEIDAMHGPHSSVAVIDTSTGRLLREFPDDVAGRNDGGCVQSLSYSHSGETVVVGTRSGEMNVIDQTTGVSVLTQLADREISIRSAISPDGSLLAAAPIRRVDQERPEFFHDVQLMKVNDPRTTVTRISTFGEVLNALEFSPRGDVLAIGGRNGLLRLVNVQLHKEFDYWDTGHGETWSVALLPDNKTMLSTGDNQVVRVWDIATGTSKTELHGHTALITCTDVATAGGFFVSGNFDGRAIRWDAATGEQQRIFAGHTGPIRCLSISRDEKWLATAGDDRQIRIWGTEHGQLVHTLAGHQDKVRSVLFHPNNRWVISAGNDGAVIVWDIMQAKTIKRWLDPTEVHALALAKDGRAFVTGNKEGAIRMYHMTGEEVGPRLTGHVGEVRALAFSSDGRTLASGGEDKVVKLWHVATGEELMKLSGTEAFINDLEFSADDSVLAAACHDGTVSVWRAPR